MIRHQSCFPLDHWTFPHVVFIHCISQLGGRATFCPRDINKEKDLLFLVFVVEGCLTLLLLTVHLDWKAEQSRLETVSPFKGRPPLEPLSWFCGLKSKPMAYEILGNVVYLNYSNLVLGEAACLSWPPRTKIITQKVY